jgi:Flp pilus assembly protein CpaB
VRRRSNLLVLLGLASFVLGLIAVYLITGDDDDGGGGGTDRASVLVATEDIPAGSLGDDVIASGAVEVVEIDVADRQLDALTSASQLSGSRLTQLFPQGEQIRTAGVASLGGARAQIPEGFEAVALSIDFVAGGASTIIPNDRVNVYFHAAGGGVPLSTDDDGNLISGTSPELVQLLLTNVLVLDVQRGTPDLAISQPADGTASTGNPGSLVVIVAVDTVDAEKVIFASTSENTELYLSRVRLDDEGNPPPPASGDPAGRSLENILAEAAADAFARSNTP